MRCFITLKLELGLKPCHLPDIDIHMLFLLVGRGLPSALLLGPFVVFSPKNFAEVVMVLLFLVLFRQRSIRFLVPTRKPRTLLGENSLEIDCVVFVLMNLRSRLLLVLIACGICGGFSRLVGIGPGFVLLRLSSTLGPPHAEWVEVLIFRFLLW